MYGLCGLLTSGVVVVAAPSLLSLWDSPSSREFDGRRSVKTALRPYVDSIDEARLSLSRFFVDVRGVSPLTRREGRADIGFGARGGDEAFRGGSDILRQREKWERGLC